MIVRGERAGDEDAIAAVIRSAFGQEDEVRLVARLRQGKELIVSLVAEIEDEVIGHIGFASSGVETGEATSPLAWLVPLSVSPDRQRHGAGSALVRAGLDACRNDGYGHAVVVGDPNYYARFGFSREAAAGLKSRWSDALLALALSTEPIPLQGRVVEPEAFAELD